MEVDPNDPHFDQTTLIARCGGMWAGGELQDTFRDEIRQLLGRTQKSFPGAQPVSFSADHFDELKREDYYLCEKTDGIRYLMYMTSDSGKPVTYLIDRKNDYYYVPDLFFPHHENNPDFSLFHENTILDGELVEEKHPDGRTEVKFLVFDCLITDSQNCTHRTLDKRLAYLQQYILKPYKDMLKRMPERRGPFTIEGKPTQFSYHTPHMFNEIIPQVIKRHGNDGVIFTCRTSEYVSGTDPHIIKWKPPEENTVDFLLHIDWQGYQPDPDDPDQSWQPDFDAFPQDLGLYINYGYNGQYERHGTLALSPAEWESLKNSGKPLQDSIVECFLEPASSDTNGHNGTNGHANGYGVAGRKWRYHRLRDDKHEANHISTFNSVIDSIEDHITKEDLMRGSDEIRAAWKRRDAEKEKVRKP